MPRGKKSGEESKMKMYSFGIDTTDPKYKNLIEMLETVDSGARSFIIRQILNQYANSQTPAPMFALVAPPNYQEPSQGTIPPSDGTVHVEEPKVEPEPPKPKKKAPPGLKALKNTFN